MTNLRPILVPASLAQVVKPFDPDTMPVPVNTSSDQSYNALLVAGVAAAVLLIVIVFALRRRKRHR